MNKIIVLVLLVGLVSAVSVLGYGVDTSPSYNDDYGWFYYLGFPFSPDVIDFLVNLLAVEGAWLEDDNTTTVIDVNDTMYEPNSILMDAQLDQLAFLQWFNYVHHAYRHIVPLDGHYSWGYNAQQERIEVVHCKPYDLNGNGVYEVICIQAT